MCDVQKFLVYYLQKITKFSLTLSLQVLYNGTCGFLFKVEIFHLVQNDIDLNLYNTGDTQ